MRPDSDLEAKCDTEGPDIPYGTDAVRQDFPSQEAVDYYLAKAKGMRARQFHGILSRAWKAMRRFWRRQLSPYTRVKLPSTSA